MILNKQLPTQTQKEWYINNPDKRKLHKEKYKPTYKEKIKCDICNNFVIKHYLKKHKKTEKCLKNLQ